LKYKNHLATVKLPGVDAKAIFDKINGEEIELTFSDGFKSAIEAYFKVSVPD
jgi:hypothetical protein